MAMKTIREEPFGKVRLRLLEKGDAYVGIVISKGKVSAPIEGDDPEELWAQLRRSAGTHEAGYVGYDGAKARFLEHYPAGFSDPEIAGEFRGLMGRWIDLLITVASEAEEKFGGLGPFSPKEMAVLIGAVFMGAETMILAGFTEKERPIRAALRKFGDLIKLAEEQATTK